MSYLLLTIRFLDGRYHGRRDGGEPEWPPSPMRLFAALLAGAKSRWSDCHCEAFKWLEGQPPLIRAARGRRGATLLTYVPNNNSDSGKTSRTGKIIRPTLLDGPPVVQYLWPVEPDEEAYAQIIAETVRHIRALGWGIDLAVGQGVILDALPPVMEGLGEYHARPAGVGGGVSLRVPACGSLHSLEKIYQSSLSRIRPDGTIYDQPGGPVCETRAYATGDDRPFCAFALQTPDENAFSLRPQQIKALVGMIRHAAACDAVRQTMANSNKAIDVDRAVLGHPPSGPGPRLSILPLPSIGHPHSDGHIRRVILAESPDGDGLLCRALSQTLDGRSLQPLPEDETLPCEIRLARLLPGDRFLQRYTRPSQSAAQLWASVTPVLLPGYDDRKQHHGNQQRRLERAETLICKALSQAGMDVPASIAISRVPWWPGSLHVRDYCPREKLSHYPRYHVQLSFDRPVTGPIAIGAGRHVGFGIFAACEE